MKRRRVLVKTDIPCVNVNSYATAGAGTSASPWTGWDTAITWTPDVTYFSPEGWYSLASSPAGWAQTRMRLIGSRAYMRFTGAGNGFSNIRAANCTGTGSAAFKIEFCVGNLYERLLCTNNDNVGNWVASLYPECGIWVGKGAEHGVVSGTYDYQIEGVRVSIVNGIGISGTLQFGAGSPATQTAVNCSAIGGAFDSITVDYSRHVGMGRQVRQHL